MSGEPATLTMNSYSVEHVIHILIGLITVVFSLLYIKHHLRTQHSLAIINAEKSPPKSVFTIKSVLIASAATFITLSLVVLLQYSKQNYPSGVFLSSACLVLVDYNFARKSCIQAYFLLQIRKFMTKNVPCFEHFQETQRQLNAVMNLPEDNFQSEVPCPQSVAGNTSSVPTIQQEIYNRRPLSNPRSQVNIRRVVSEHLPPVDIQEQLPQSAHDWQQYDRRF